MHEFLSNIYIKINCLLSISNKPNGKIDMQSGNTTKSQAESHHFSTLESSLLFNSSKGFFFLYFVTIRTKKWFKYRKNNQQSKCEIRKERTAFVLIELWYKMKYFHNCWSNHTSRKTVQWYSNIYSYALKKCA